METFLAKSDTRKLQLLHVIEESFQQQISISDLKTKMGVSEFIVISTYEEIKQDIKDFKLGKTLVIQKFNKIIKMKKALNFSSDILKNNYIKRSLGFQIIQDLFDNRFINPSEYANRYYISRTKVYSQVTQLREQFKKFDILFSNSFHLIGDELAIRMYFYNMYSGIYGVHDYPFSSKSKNEIFDFIQQLEIITKTTLSQTSINKLLYFVKVSNYRSEQGKAFKSKLLKIPLLNGEEIEAFINKAYHFSFGRQISKSEAQLLGNFIVSLDEFSDYVEAGPLALKDQPVDELTTYFINEFKTYFNGQVSTGLEERLQAALKKIHFNVLTFKTLQNEMDTPVEARFFNENYPEALRFCDDFIQTAIKNPKYHLIKMNSVYLYNQYILLLIEVFPPSFFSRPVRICVDFSLGINYNKFIIRNIRSFDFLNIEITSQVTSDESIDIFLGDFMIESLGSEIKSIIWNAPPTVGDWANFGDCIAEIQQAKKDEE